MNVISNCHHRPQAQCEEKITTSLFLVSTSNKSHSHTLSYSASLHRDLEPSPCLYALVRRSCSLWSTSLSPLLHPSLPLIFPRSLSSQSQDPFIPKRAFIKHICHKVLRWESESDMYRSEGNKKIKDNRVQKHITNNKRRIRFVSVCVCVSPSTLSSVSSSLTKHSNLKRKSETQWHCVCSSTAEH